MLYDLVVANAVFGSLWTVALWSPKYWWVGVHTGAFLGFFYYCLRFGMENSKDT